MNSRLSTTFLATIPFALAIGLAGCQQPEVPEPQAETALPAGAPAPAPVAEVAGPQALAAAEVQVDFTAVDTCNMEQVDGQAFAAAPIEVKAGSEFSVTGFVFNQRTKSIPGDVVLRLTSDAAANPQAWEGAIKGRVNRPDIPTYFKLENWAADSGYEQQFSSKGLSPGSYHMMITFTDGAQKLICDNGRHLTIAP